jgi:hypothetical protein
MKSARRSRPGLARRLGLDHNPMRRRSDRIQTLARAAALVLLVVGCVNAVVVGRTAHDRRLAAERVDARIGYRVTGNVVSDPSAAVSPDGYPIRDAVRVSWRDRAGRPHAQVVVAPIDVRTVPLWIGADGDASTTAPTGSGAAIAGASAGLSRFFATAAGLAASLLAFAFVLHRRRMAEWEREWASVEPGWRRQTL